MPSHCCGQYQSLGTCRCSVSPAHQVLRLPVRPSWMHPFRHQPRWLNPELHASVTYCSEAFPRMPAHLFPWLTPRSLPRQGPDTRTLWIPSGFLLSSPLPGLARKPLPMMGKTAQLVKVLAVRHDGGNGEVTPQNLSSHLYRCTMAQEHLLPYEI